MKNPYLNRSTSGMLKGVLLIFMFIHHFFTWPEYYITGIAYPELVLFARVFRTPLRICVPVFAFLTGYFYWFSKTKTFRYSLRKITDFLLSYWAVYLPLLVLAVVLGTYKPAPIRVVRELFALDTPIMFFCWYVNFYCVAMLLMPVLAKLSSGSLFSDIFLLMVLPSAAAAGIMDVLYHEFGIEGGFLFGVLSEIEEWMPVMACGYLAAKHSWFETYFDTLSAKFSHSAGKILLWLGLALAAFLGRYLCPRFALGSIQLAGHWTDLIVTMDIVYAPIFVYAMANLLKLVKLRPVITVLERLGQQSMLMWFLHSVFFNVSKEFTQPILYFLKNPLLVLVFGLLLCYLLAVLIDKLTAPVLKWKRKIL